MPDESYTAWMNIFDNDLSKVYSQERKELKSAAMIFCALQREFERIKTTTELELNDIRKDLQEKDECLERKYRLSMSSKENTPPLKTLQNKNTESNSQDSPLDFTDNSNVIDLSISDSQSEDPPRTPSPTLNKKKKKKVEGSPSLCFVSVNSKRDDDFKAPMESHEIIDLDESTVIESTPEVRTRRVKSIKSNLFLSKKKLMNSMRPAESRIMSQFLTQGTNSNKNFTPVTKSTNTDINKKPEASTSKITDDTDWEITQIDESLLNRTQDTEEVSKSTMEITDMLDYINKKSPQALNQASVDANTFNLNDTVIDEENLNFTEEIPAKKSRLNDKKPLKGWSCQECKNFYEYMNLPPEELRKKMEECSKHKAKKIQEETIPGFWDMTIKSQN